VKVYLIDDNPLELRLFQGKAILYSSRTFHEDIELLLSLSAWITVLMAVTSAFFITYDVLLCPPNDQ
jgi:5'(3')-deoxyribonucleotidase